MNCWEETALISLALNIPVQHMQELRQKTHQLIWIG